MSASRPKLRLFMDESVPTDVGLAFEAHGHEVILLDQALKRGSSDVMVCTAALANEAILVAFDKDMKQLAKRHGLGGGRFKTLSLIEFGCAEHMAAKRLEQAMTFIEHEWNYSSGKVARRLHVFIGKGVLRSHR